MCPQKDPGLTPSSSRDSYFIHPARSEFIIEILSEWKQIEREFFELETEFSKFDYRADLLAPGPNFAVYSNQWRDWDRHLRKERPKLDRNTREDRNNEYRQEFYNKPLPGGRKFNLDDSVTTGDWFLDPSRALELFYDGEEIEEDLRADIYVDVPEGSPILLYDEGEQDPTQEAQEAQQRQEGHGEEEEEKDFEPRAIDIIYIDKNVQRPLRAGKDFRKDNWTRPPINFYTPPRLREYPPRNGNLGITLAVPYTGQAVGSPGQLTPIPTPESEVIDFPPEDAENQTDSSSEESESSELDSSDDSEPSEEPDQTGPSTSHSHH